MNRPDRDASLLGVVREAFGNSGRRYGYKRVHLELRGMGIRVSAKRVMRLMTRHGLVPLLKRARRLQPVQGRDRRRGAGQPRQPGLPRRGAGPVVGGRPDGFPHPPRGQGLPSVRWVDCCDGMPVAWTIGTSPNAEPANRMLRDALLHARRRGASDHPLRPRLPLPVARMDPHPQRAQADPIHEREGAAPRTNAAAEGFFGRPRAGVLSAGATSPASPSRGSSNDWTHT